MQLEKIGQSNGKRSGDGRRLRSNSGKEVKLSRSEQWLARCGSQWSPQTACASRNVISVHDLSLAWVKRRHSRPRTALRSCTKYRGRSGYARKRLESAPPSSNGSTCPNVRTRLRRYIIQVVTDFPVEHVSYEAGTEDHCRHDHQVSQQCRRDRTGVEKAKIDGRLRRGEAEHEDLQQQHYRSGYHDVSSTTFRGTATTRTSIGKQTSSHARSSPRIKSFSEPYPPSPHGAGTGNRLSAGKAGTFPSNRVPS